MVRVELDDILFIEGLKNYVSIYQLPSYSYAAGDEATGRDLAF